MAASGYKLFVTGDVLTAAQVNDYLMLQTVMVFANSAARTTALSGVLAEGLVSYLKDTDVVEVYTGAAWVSLDDPNAIQNSIVDAKGDLIAASADNTPARLAVGNNGETLVADSSATTGLRYSATPSASNPFLNTAFQIWQRGTTFAYNNQNAYTADRWYMSIPNTAATVSRQTTSDTTNLPFIQYCARLARNSGTTNTGTITVTQSAETVNTIPFAGKTVTMSFYARAGANFSAASNALYVYLVTGTGTDQNQASGYTGQATPLSGTATLTTTWQRFTYTGTIATSATEMSPNIGYTPVGTAGANDYFEFTGFQVDIGSVALPFRTQNSTIQGELAACQRYYWRQTADATALYAHLGYARGDGATSAIADTPVPVTMRVTPTVVDYSNIGITDGAAVYVPTSVALSANQSNAKFPTMLFSFASGVTQFRFYYIVSNNNAAGYLGLGAEL